MAKENFLSYIPSPFIEQIFFFNLSNIEINIDEHLQDLKFDYKDHRAGKSKENSFEILCQFWI